MSRNTTYLFIYLFIQFLQGLTLDFWQYIIYVLMYKYRDRQVDFSSPITAMVVGNHFWQMDIRARTGDFF